jgi:voltage-gated potassium channel
MTRRGIIKVLNGTHPVIGRKVALVIYALIVLSSVVIAVETLPSLSERTRRWLVVAEFTILTVFAIEYVLRLTCSRRPLAYAFSFWGIVDFISIVPGGPVPVSRPRDRSGPCGSCGFCGS